MGNTSPVLELRDEDVFGVSVIEEARDRNTRASFPRTTIPVHHESSIRQPVVQHEYPGRSYSQP